MAQRDGGDERGTRKDVRRNKKEGGGRGVRVVDERKNELAFFSFFFFSHLTHVLVHTFFEEWVCAAGLLQITTTTGGKKKGERTRFRH